MRLILVHGINQECRSEDLIKTEWLGALEAGLGLSGTTKGARRPCAVLRGYAGASLRSQIFGRRCARSER